jgi:hypothetical protein
MRAGGGGELDKLLFTVGYDALVGRIAAFEMVGWDGRQLKQKQQPAATLSVPLTVGPTGWIVADLPA